MNDNIPPQSDTDRVRAGMALLDRLLVGRPGWRDDLDVDRLDMGDPWDCVLGQLYGTYADGLRMLVRLGANVSDEITSVPWWKSAAHMRALDDIHDVELLDLATRFAYDHGFNILEGGDVWGGYRRLYRAWHYELTGWEAPE